MKKIFSIMAAGLVALSVSAQASYDLNNPIGEDGRYIVKWDCAKGQFAESNNFEPGETFTFAVDITGTGWVDAIQAGGPEGSSRAMAANIWTNYGPKKDATNRLKQIQGNIYGATYNFQQMLENNDANLIGKITAQDTIVYAFCQLFIFTYTADNNGAEWYVDAQAVQAPGSDCFFATIPSTGKSDDVFYADDFEEGMYGISEKGYAAPCVQSEATAVETVAAEGKAVKVLEDGQLIIKHNGVRYNALGTAIH